jgi:cytochrome P450
MTEPRPDCPSLDIDPFSREFLSDPYPYHERLREAGPVLWLERHGVVAMARYAEVRDALQDWKTFCSGRGAGLTDFARETPWRPPSIILEADPPLHTRTRGVLSKVLARGALERFREAFPMPPRDWFATCSTAARSTPCETSPRRTRSASFRTRSGCARTAARTCCRTATWPSTRSAAQRAVRGVVRERAGSHGLDPGAVPPRGAGRRGIGAQVYKAADEESVSEDEAGLLVRSLLTAGLDTTIFGIGAALYALRSSRAMAGVARRSAEGARRVRGGHSLHFAGADLFRTTTTGSK